MGTDASGQMQVYGVVTDNEGKAVTGAGGKQVTKKYTTTKAGQKNTTTTPKTSTTKKPTTTKPNGVGNNSDDDLPEPENPGWGPGHDASLTPFELKEGYDSYLFNWINSGIGDMTGRGRSNHTDSPKSTLSDWTYDAVRKYANTGKMSWDGIMNHVEKNKEFF